MNRKLIVTLLRKDIQELDMITEGFMEMTEYPKAIILLAQRKTDDIQSYIQQLSNNDIEVDELGSITETVEEPLFSESVEINSVVEDIKIIEIPEAIKDIPENEILEESVVQNTEDNTVIIEMQETFEDSELVNDIDETDILENRDEIELTETTTELEIEITVEETRKTILGEKNFSTTHTRNELLSKADNSISSTLANKKIDDIKQAINIGDRFRFQRELFRGNGEEMNKTLTYLNQLATLAEAESFLQSKYGWATENESAEDFFQIVRRRFL